MISNWIQFGDQILPEMIIEQSLRFIKEELSNFLINDLGDSGVDIELGNIALFETENSSNVDEKLIITLVNLEEESTLKNSRNYQKTINGGINYVSPAVFLNLYLLFCCNYNLYDTALKRLGDIILFFQQRSRFDINSATSLVNENLFSEQNYEFRLTFELYTLTFEQINHLWGSLGGRQIPSIMYKARLIRIDDTRARRVIPPIEEVQNTI